MILMRFQVPDPAHDSFIVGDSNSIAVINPQRDVDTYIEYAQSESLQIVYVVKTCIDPDALPVAAALASRTGADLCFSGYAGNVVLCRVPHRALFEGDELPLDKLVLKVVRNHDHAPAGIDLLLLDPSKSSSPIASFPEDALPVELVDGADFPDMEGKERLTRALRRGIQRIQELQCAWNV